MNLLRIPDRTMRALLFSPASRHVGPAAPSFHHALLAEPLSRRREGTGDMRKLGSLLRATPSRLRRRLAQIVAIAAASLPAAGA